MSVRLLAVVAAVTVCAAMCVAMPRPSTSAEQSNEAVSTSIDFDALRAQATAALDALQQSRERRFLIRAD
ncbi:MAG: hypothetical protein ACM3IH_21040 [Sphingobacteriales bacterium]|jgi:hypothetical protein